MPTRLLLLLFSLILLLLLGGVAQAGVVVADGSVPMQTVVDGAANGDIVLVKPAVAEFAGTVTIDGKSLTLVADGGVPILARLIVKNVPAGGQVTLRGLSLDALGPVGGVSAAALEITDCAGSVWIETCSITPPPQNPGSFGSSSQGMHAVFVRDSAAVVVARSRLEGGDGAPEQPSCVIPGYAPASRGGDGLRAVRTTVAVHGSALEGGRGGYQANFSCHFGGAPGGAGLHVDDAIVHAAASELTGGDMDLTALDSSAPGNGLVVATASSLVSVRGTSVEAGQGPPVVLPIDAPAGTFVVDVETPRTIAVTSPLREHQGGQLDIDGLPGDLVAVFVAFTGAALPQPAKQGVWSLGTPSFGPLLLAVNPVGDWTIPFAAGGLVPASLDGQSYLLQLVVRTPTSQVRLEGTTTYALIDAAIP